MIAKHTYLFAQSITLKTLYYGSYSHKKQKDSLETRAVLLISSFELEISGVAIQSIHQNNKKDGFWEELLSENDMLATLCCYNHDSNASKAVQKIATNQK